MYTGKREPIVAIHDLPFKGWQYVPLKSTKWANIRLLYIRRNVERNKQQRFGWSVGTNQLGPKWPSVKRSVTIYPSVQQLRTAAS